MVNEISDPHMIVNKIRNLHTTFFIGAGTGISYKLPQKFRLPSGEEIKKRLLLYWKNLPYEKINEVNMNQIEKEFVDRFNIEERITPEIIWQKVWDERGHEITEKMQFLKEMLDAKKPVPPAYKYLMRIFMHSDKISTIFTTNFDEKMEDFLMRERLYRNIIFAVTKEDFERLSEVHGELKIIFKLHGTFSKPYTIISGKNEALYLPDWKRKVLENSFKTNRVIIFIGYGGKDHDIISALHNIRENINVQEPVYIYWISLSKPPEKIVDIFNRGPFQLYFMRTEADKFLQVVCTSLTLFPSKRITHERLVDVKDYLTRNGPRVINSLKRVKNFNDPVFGEINFNLFDSTSSDELASSVVCLLNSGEMQRLRDIKQLSFVHYRFPSATHSRFSHSLGVAYLVAKALSVLKRKGVSITPEDLKDTVCAALLHDIGHGPFGHVIDTLIVRLPENERREYQLQHEKLTYQFITDPFLLDLDNIFGYIAIKKYRVGELARGHRPYDNKLFLSQLIAGYALDMDRLDFILRDLYFTGLKTETVERILNRLNLWSTNGRRELINDLLESIDVCQGNSINISSEDREWIDIKDDIQYLCFEERVKDKILEMFQLYKELYLNVYYNETNMCAQAMIAKALELCKEIGELDIRTIHQFTDSDLFTYLHDSEHPVARRLTWGVQYRRLFKKVCSFSSPSHKEVEISELEKELMSEYGLYDDNTFSLDVDSLIIVHIPPKKGGGLKNLILKRKDEEAYLYYEKDEKIQELITDFDSSVRGFVFASWNNRKVKEDEGKKIRDYLEGKGFKIHNN